MATPESRAGEYLRPSRVLIVEAHPVVRLGLRAVVERTLCAVGVVEAADADEAYRAYLSVRPDVAVVGSAMPPTGGLELIRRFAAADAKPAILAFGAAPDSHLAVRALDAGALGFLSHQDDVTTMMQGIEQVARRMPFLPPALVERVALQRVLKRSNPLAALSPREFEIFRLVAEARSPGEIAGLLQLNLRSVTNYKAIIKRKLEVSTTAGMVHLAIRSGVVRVTSEAESASDRIA